TIIKEIEKAKIRLKANVNFDVTLELLLFVMKENGVK
ncbi:MAG: DNA polymerase III subunit delta, partial [Lachnospiraceae bacterium]|nr:DNA polymerase III subunit delta [Lachnospiraceae bacterium]